MIKKGNYSVDVILSEALPHIAFRAKRRISRISFYVSFCGGHFM